MRKKYSRIQAEQKSSVFYLFFLNGLGVNSPIRFTLLEWPAILKNIFCWEYFLDDLKTEE
jgi:hypothetical protein